MSDRSLVIAMWHKGHREWNDRYALDFVLISGDALARGIITESTHLATVRAVRVAQRRYEQLRLDGVSETVALELMLTNDNGAPAGMDSLPASTDLGSADRNT